VLLRFDSRLFNSTSYGIIRSKDGTGDTKQLLNMNRQKVVVRGFSADGSLGAEQLLSDYLRSVFSM